MTSDQEEDVHNPPDSQTSQCQQLPHPSPRQPQTEPVEAEEAEQDAVEERGDEVVVGVADAGKPFPEKCSGSGALNTIKDTATRGGLLHLLPPLTPVPETSVTHLGVGGLITLVIEGLRTDEKLFW